MNSPGAQRSHPTISAILIAKDEERDLPRALSSLEGKVDEIVVVDTGSSDSTVVIATDAGAKVSHFEWIDDFAAARNASIEAATADWCLQLDADEELTSSSGELRHALRRAPAESMAIWVRITDSKGSSFSAARLFRRTDRIRFRNRIHEHIVLRSLSGEDEVAFFIAPSELMIHHFAVATDTPEEMEKRRARDRALIDRAAAEEPDDPLWRFYQARDRMARRDFEGALAAFAKMDAVAPGHRIMVTPTSRRDLAVCLFETGSIDAALQVLSEARTRYPDYTDLFFFSGLILGEVWRDDEARDLLRRCLELGEPPPIYETWGGTGEHKPRIALSDLARPLPKA